jgi:hypothetical protein
MTPLAFRTPLRPLQLEEHLAAVSSAGASGTLWHSAVEVEAALSSAFTDKFGGVMRTLSDELKAHYHEDVHMQNVEPEGLAADRVWAAFALRHQVGVAHTQVGRRADSCLCHGWPALASASCRNNRNPRGL